jgi:hypothetical protein
MKPISLLLLAASFLAAPLFVSSTAYAQQYAAVSSCSLGVDGGTGTSTLTCPAVTLAFQPATLTCEVTTAGSHIAGSVTLQVSGDSVHYGPIQDGGITLYFNQDISTTTTLTAPLLIGSGGGSLQDPYTSSQIVASITSNDGGTAGGATLNCQTSVVQTQTLHATRKK